MYSVEPLDITIVDSWSVARSGLPTRAANALAAAGILTIGELRAMRTETLRRVPGLGARTLGKTADFLKLCGRIADDNGFEACLDDVFDCFLDGRETQTLKRRYGLAKPTLVPLPKGETLQAIAADWRITRERVRQMEERALERLSSLCGQALLSGLCRLFADGIAAHGGAIEPNTVAEIVDRAATDNYPSAAVLRLLCDCTQGLVFHNGFFTTVPAEILTSVAETALAYLGERPGPQAAADVYEAVETVTDLPAATRDHITATALLHAPGIGTTRDGRYFLPESAAADLAAEVMSGHAHDFHYRDLQARFNALMHSGSRKGSGCILDILTHDPRFERTRPGRYRLRRGATAGAPPCA